MSQWQGKKIKHFVISVLIWHNCLAFASSRAEIAYRRAERIEQHFRQTKTLKLLNQAIEQYYATLKLGNEIWSNRSAYRIANLLDDTLGQSATIKQETLLLYERLLTRAQETKDRELIAELKTHLRKPLTRLAPVRLNSHK